MARPHSTRIIAPCRPPAAASPHVAGQLGCQVILRHEPLQLLLRVHQVAGGLRARHSRVASAPGPPAWRGVWAGIARLANAHRSAPGPASPPNKAAPAYLTSLVQLAAEAGHLLAQLADPASQVLLLALAFAAAIPLGSLRCVHAYCRPGAPARPAGAQPAGLLRQGLHVADVGGAVEQTRKRRMDSAARGAGQPSHHPSTSCPPHPRVLGGWATSWMLDACFPGARRRADVRT